MTHALSLIILSCLLQTGASLPPDSKALPEVDSFLQNARRQLHSDRFIQSNYTYIEKSISRQLDSDGKVKKTETKVYEVYPSIDEQLTYRKLIAKNEKPLTEDEIRKSDDEFEKRRREWERNLKRDDAEAKRRWEAKNLEDKKKEEKVLDEAFGLYRVTMIGRDQVEGIPVIVLAFDPRPDYEPRTKEGKILSKVRGKAWFTEADQELVRIEATLIDRLSFGFGILAKLNEGARLVFQRREVNDEVWLPARSYFSGTGRILFLKSFRIEQETIYSDYQRFSVETVVKVQPKGEVEK